MKHVYCNGCGAILKEGIYSIDSFIKWDEDQLGPEDIRRDQVIPVPLPTFGKLHFPDKMAFSAASMALKNITDAGGERSGICISLPYGSLSTDIYFMESVINQFPSPAYFSATLPSSIIADIAIYYKFKGPDRVFCGGDSSVIESILNAFRLIQLNKVDSVLTLAVWAVDKGHRTKITELNMAQDAAFCFYLSTESITENSHEVELVMNNPNASYDLQTEYSFCKNFLDALRADDKVQMPVLPDAPENYILIK